MQMSNSIPEKCIHLNWINVLRKLSPENVFMSMEWSSCSLSKSRYSLFRITVIAGELWTLYSKDASRLQLAVSLKIMNNILWLLTARKFIRGYWMASPISLLLKQLCSRGSYLSGNFSFRNSNWEPIGSEELKSLRRMRTLAEPRWTERSRDRPRR